MNNPLDQVVRHLGERLGLDDFVADEDGSYRLQFDDHINVVVSLQGRSIAVFESVLGMVPDDELQAEQLLKKVLTRSLFHYRTCVDVVCYDQDSEKLVLHKSLDLDDISVSEFHDEVESYLNVLEAWKKTLNDSYSTSLPAMPMQFVMP